MDDNQVESLRRNLEAVSKYGKVRNTQADVLEHAIITMHRTEQQDLMRAVGAIIRVIAESPNDGRNQASVEQARAIIEAYPDLGYGLPYV